MAIWLTSAINLSKLDFKKLMRIRDNNNKIAINLSKLDFKIENELIDSMMRNL